MTPLVGNQGVIVNVPHVYRSWCNILVIFVKELVLPAIYLADPQDISWTVDHGRFQHIVEVVCGVKVLVVHSGGFRQDSEQKSAKRHRQENFESSKHRNAL
jgi:hypothetical protein